MRLLELFEQITSRRVKHMEQEFSCGSCMYLALVLNAKYNWPLVGFLSYDDADELEGIIHIWVEPPGTQKAVDIYGVHDVGKFTNELEETSKLYGGEYEHDISPELVKRFIWSGRVYYPRKDRMFYGDEPHPQRKTQQEKFHKQALKQAYRAMQDYLIPQMQQHGLVSESLTEGQPIRSYDPGVIEWLQEAMKRPDADELYLHGSQQEQNVFDPKLKTWEHALLHFSKLTDPRSHDTPPQAEYFGHKLWLVKLNYKKPFDVRYPDSEAAMMYDKLVPNHYYQHRLSYEDLHEVVPAALERGYDMFVVFEIAVTTESYAVPNYNQVEVVDIFDATKEYDIQDAARIERMRAAGINVSNVEGINESLADQLIDSKVARKFTYIAMAVKMHKDESVMADLVERAVNEFLSRLEDGKYARLEDAEHDRNTLLDMIYKVTDKLYLHDEIKQGSKTAQILAGSLNLARIGSFQAIQEPVDGSQAVNTPTLS